MLDHEKSSDLLDSTMDVLNADPATSTPQSGTGVINSWLEELRKADNAADITNSLEQVKTQLESGEISAGELSDLFTTLATQTVEFSTRLGSEGDIAYRLEGLASALRSLAGQLGNQ
ncbi:hypothetical protein [Spirosoma oryzicola]|uniref:hypothetical protein n=1 Tax=Spirosoma oryzicola TaxID=2898794 RepID=UPI001E484F58|nr:hypothetical protein [Spirosoma oryzicola]UHG92203.1 hypothetical protein LQ777_04675 [Spirosoma oryzicola]